MPNRKTKPTSPGRRFATYQQREEVTTDKPHKPLTKGKGKSGGRNARGRVTSRHRGGGAKRRYREIDFKRIKDGVPAKVASIEYDPNRSAHIALLHYADGEKRYIIAPARLTVGATVESGPNADIQPGLRPRIIPRRFGFDCTLETLTAVTCTSKSCSTACRICTLCASGCTLNVYLRSEIRL